MTKLALVLLASVLASCAEPAPRPAQARALDLGDAVAVPTSTGAVVLAVGDGAPRVTATLDLDRQATDASIGPDGLVWVVAPFDGPGAAAREVVAADPATGTVVRRVALPAALRRPVGLVHGPSASYVRSDRDGRGFAIGAIDRTSGRVDVIAEVEPAGGGFGRGLELVGDTLYAFSTWSSTAPEHQIHAIEASTGRVVGRAPLGGYYAVVGRRAFVTRNDSATGPTLSVIDLPRLTVLASVSTPDLPLVAASASGVYLAHWDGGEAAVYDPALRAVGPLALPPPRNPALDPVGDGFRVLGRHVLLNPEALRASTLGAFVPLPLQTR